MSVQNLKLFKTQPRVWMPFPGCFGNSTRDIQKLKETTKNASAQLLNFVIAVIAIVFAAEIANDCSGSSLRDVDPKQ